MCAVIRNTGRFPFFFLLDSNFLTELYSRLQHEKAIPLRNMVIDCRTKAPIHLIQTLWHLVNPILRILLTYLLFLKYIICLLVSLSFFYPLIKSFCQSLLFGFYHSICHKHFSILWLSSWRLTHWHYYLWYVLSKKDEQNNWQKN